MKLNWNFQKGGGGKDIFWNYTLKNGNQFEKEQICACDSPT